MRSQLASTSPTPPKEFDELTTREQEAFQLIANGLSNTEIAQELYISDTTVKSHVTHIVQELNLRDRMQAVVLAYQTGPSRATRGGQAVATRARLADFAANRFFEIWLLPAREELSAHALVR
jgi:DNA-binding CsgD family transcriptional regulator